MVELSGIVILGILAQWVAWKLKIPAILPLILIGLLVGPLAAEYLSSDGTKWIQPIYNGEKRLFPGESLFYFVSLAISIILFEGGLTLRVREIKNIGPVITKLITIGSTVTFFGGAVAAHYIFYLSWEMSFLFSALIVVTGPTVITPILRHIPLKQDVSAVLRWEGILIDPIGALVAVLVFEFISVDVGGAFTKTAFIEFGKIVLFGSTFGFAFAHGLNFIMNKRLIPHYLLNVFALASVLGVFVLADEFAHESGLLAVVVMGMVLGNSNSPYLKELLYFKESLSILLVSILFILLAANIDMEDLRLVLNWNMVALFAVVVFVLRPIGVLWSTYKSTLKFNEKIFISWVGPRGIVAAGIASLFGLKLARNGVQDAEYITPLVFMIVLGTVILNATTARYIAKLLGVFLKKANGILIVGASKSSRLIGNYLQKNGRRVVLLDNNQINISKAKELGLEGIVSNVYEASLEDNIELNDIGYIIALTGNSDINQFAINRFGKEFGQNGVFRLITADELSDPNYVPKEHIFIQTDDFISLTETTRKHPAIHEIDIQDKKHYESLIDLSEKDENIIPMFLKDELDVLHIISDVDIENEKFTEGWKLVYLGKPYDVEKIQKEKTLSQEKEKAPNDNS
ncbi:cation:proton antiporter [Gelidibacter japonicus]|uniref:cation:proton antiporter n=1 Tax=Gelidibacter japonicus TaxID=1962232 RepID=UPI0020221DCA|nr:sodium:proton antiporter [Gelidibacter japonicus]MCL8008150.1 cation:proton antiporter [Gelidibacter japonicus]